MVGGNNEKLGVVRGEDDEYFKKILDRYLYPTLTLNGLIMEYDPNYPNLCVHVGLWIHYGDKVSYDNYVCMVGNIFVEARKDWYNHVRVCSYSPDLSYYEW